MKQIAKAVLTCACLAGSLAMAADKAAGTTAPATGTTMATPTAAKTEPGSTMTCGQMMEAKAPLPAKMGELMTAIADNLDAHAKWMAGMKGDKAAQNEAKVMAKIAKSHKDLGTTYTKLADEMRKQKDLPGATHDPKTLDMAKMAEGTARQVKLTREMAQMLMKDADETEKMMNQMRGQGGSGH